MIGMLCLGAALATAPLAPAPEAIGPGTRIRLTFGRDADPLAYGRTSAETRRAGRVVAVGDRTVRMAFDGHPRPVEVATASVVRLERSLGRRPRGKAALRGTGTGLLVGATSGVLAGYASGDNSAIAPNAAILGALGAIVGAVAGARSGERWERGAIVFANERVGLYVVPAGRRGAGISVSVGF